MVGIRGAPRRKSKTRGNTLRREELFGLLSNRRRRYALYYLMTNRGAATIGELAEQIAAWEHDTTLDGVTSRQRKLVYNSLQQTHLPKLADKGVVEYDDRQGTVELASDVDDSDIEQFLGDALETRLPWSGIYLLLAGTIGVLSVAVSLGVYPFAVVDPITWLLVLSGSVLMCATLHYRRSRSDGIGSADEPPEVRYQGR